MPGQKFDSKRWVLGLTFSERACLKGERWVLGTTLNKNICIHVRRGEEREVT